MIVIDASVLGLALLDESALGDRARGVLTADDRWVMPEIWTTETLSLIRGRLLGGKITEDHANEAIAAVSALEPVVPLTRVLVERIWTLRHNLTAHDAAYVAAAETYGCTLVTGDVKLAKADGLRCAVAVLN